MQVQDLRDELLVGILGFLPLSDLKTARITCSRWSSIGVKWLFQRVYFAPRKSVMQNFEEGASRPCFARNVADLIYDGRLSIPKLGRYREHKEWLALALPEKLLDYNISGRTEYERHGDDFCEMAAESLMKYRPFLEQQQCILDESEDFAALGNFLPKLPKLTKVVIQDVVSDTAEQPGLGGPNSQHDCKDWYDAKDTAEFDQVLRPAQWLQEYNTSNADGDPTAIDDWDLRGLTNLLRALALHCTKLKEFHLGSRSSQVPYSLFHDAPDVTEDACVLVRQLTCLKLGCRFPLSYDSLDWDHFLTKTSPALEKILAEAKQVHHLSFDGDMDIRIFCHQRWTQLKTLELGNIAVRAKDMRAISKAHRHTLRNLTLRRIWVVGRDDWSNVGVQIGRSVKLHYLHVDHLVSCVCDEINYIPESYISDEYTLEVVHHIMQWLPEDMMELEMGPNLIVATLNDSQTNASNSEVDGSSREETSSEEG